MTIKDSLRAVRTRLRHGARVPPVFPQRGAVAIWPIPQATLKRVVEMDIVATGLRLIVPPSCRASVEDRIAACNLIVVMCRAGVQCCKKVKNAGGGSDAGVGVEAHHQ